MPTIADPSSSSVVHNPSTEGDLDVAALCEHRALPPDEHAMLHDGWCCPYERAARILRGEPDPHADAAEWRIDLDAALKPNGSIPLSLNDRGKNPFAHAAAVERVKAITRNAVRAADVPVLGHVHVELHYRPKTNAKRDADNLVATLKPVIDALHQPDERSRWQPIVPDDDARFVSWSRPRIHRKDGAPGLWVVLRSSLALAGATVTITQGATG